MNFRHLIAMFVLVAIGLPIVNSQAKLPKAKSHAIVPGQSIGGVKLGAKFKTVQRVWGKNKTCKPEAGAFTCTYFGGRTKGTAYVIQIASKVRTVEIDLGATPSGQPVFAGPLMKFKTKSGIGFGSTQAQVQAAYPAAQLTAFDVLTIDGAAKTTFGLYNGVVYKIGITR